MTAREEFVIALNAHIAAVQSRRDFRQQRIRDTRAEVMRLYDAAHPAKAEAVAVPEVVRSAPERIWLQVSDDEYHVAETFPATDEGVTWCRDSVVACEVKYVRADLAAPPAPGAEKDAERLLHVFREIDGYDGVDIHEQASINASFAGRDEPNDADYIAAIRATIDAAMSGRGA